MPDLPKPDAGKEKRAAFHGSLKDLGIVDLVQFPHNGRKTGLLVVTGTTEEAHLYYEDGNLTHARLGSIKGVDALNRVVDWTEGIFAYYPEVRFNRRTIQMDFDQLLFQVISKGERPREISSDHLLVEFEQLTREPPLEGLLEDFCSSHPQILHVCILGNDGSLITQSRRGSQALSDIDRIRGALAHFAGSYPGPNLTRIILEEDRWTGVFNRVSRECSVVLLADKRATMGVVTVAANKLVSLIEGQNIWPHP